MSTYRMIEIVGTSPNSFEEAIKNGLKDARGTLQDSTNSLEGYQWFEVVDQRGSMKEGEVIEFQIKLNVGFKVEKK